MNMAIVNRDTFLESLHKLTGDNPAEDVMKLSEDIMDTYDDAVNQNVDNINWKNKYEENDKEWKKKYHDRFFSPQPLPEDKDPLVEEEEKQKPKAYKFEDLFKKGE